MNQNVRCIDCKFFHADDKDLIIARLNPYHEITTTCSAIDPPLINQENYYHIIEECSCYEYRPCPESL